MLDLDSSEDNELFPTRSILNAELVSTSAAVSFLAQENTGSLLALNSLCILIISDRDEFLVLRLSKNCW